MAGPSDVNIVVTLDDSDILKKLTEISSKLDGFASKIKETTTKGKEGFETMGKAAEGLKSKMETLQTVLLGAGFVEFAKHALEASKSIVDLANANDMTVPRLLQLREAFIKNGGDAEKLGMVLSKLDQNLQGARDGSAKAQEALLKLGFTFSDMANLNTDEALQKVIDKLAHMEDPVKRNALAFETLGKGARNINWAGIAAGTASATDEYNKYAESLRKGQEAQIKIQEATEKLQIAFVNLLDKSHILDFINSLNTDFDKFEKIVTIAGTAFSLYFGASVLNTMAMAWRNVAGGIALADTALAKLGTTAGAVVGVITKVAGALFLLLHSEDLNAGEDQQIEKIHKFQDALTALGPAAVKSYMAMSAEQQKQVQILYDQGKALDEAMNVAQGRPSGGGKNPAVTAAWQGEVNAINARAAAWKNLIENQRAQYDLATSQIGQSVQQTEVQKRITELALKYKDELMKINEEESKVTGNSQAAKDKRGAFEQLKKTLADIYQTEIDGETKSAQARQNADADQAKTIELLKERLSNELKLSELNDAKAKLLLGAQGGAQEEIRYKNEQEAIKETAALREKLLGATNAANPLFNVPADVQAQLDAVKDRWAKITAEEQKSQQGLYEYSRLASTGLISSINKFTESAGNAAELVTTEFNTMTKGIEDAFVNFAKTGTLSFKSMTDMMIEDFIRWEVRVMESQALKAFMGSSAGGSSGGLLDSLFGGGHAMGGSIPAGQFGLVGEQGPELVRGPAAVTNANQTADMLGGQTNHTYNINAIDAKSVAQLFAENRMTMFAMTEQARRELPMRTR